MTTNTNTPKPIDTHYNGYKFRSRLEARWSIFFDELHIPYAYEPEGFDLNGTWYLPDFHLTAGLVLHNMQLTQPDQIWVEIKPDTDLAEDDRQKMAEFVKQTDHHILLIAGDPDINTSLKFIDHHPQTGWFVTDVRWLQTEDGRIGLIPVENLNNNDLLTQTNTPRLRYALDKARQARFEFGQTPLPPQKEPPKPEAAPQPEPQTLPSDRHPKTRTKTCQSCGRQFTPYRDHFIYCAKCYHEQKKTAIVSHKVSIASPHESENRPAARRTPQPRSAAPTRSTKTRLQPKHRSRLLYYLLSFIIISGFIITTIWAVNYIVAGGMFGAVPTAVPTVAVPAAIPATYTPRPTPSPIISTCTCTTNTYNCADFTTQAEAQACYDRCYPTAGDIHFLDSDGDGRVCVALP